MKRFIFYILAWVGVLSLASCEKDLPVYSDSTSRLNFYYDISSTKNFRPELARSSYSFVYGSETAVDDTLWFEVETMGFIADNDRPISLEQVQVDGANNAVADKHYQSFSTPSLQKYYVVPAGKARTKIPVVLLRDASLKIENVVLKFAIKPNEYFANGYDPYCERTIEFTDQLSEPSMWNYNYGDDEWPWGFWNYFGTYGVVKHKFLIEQTGEKWDDEYIKSLMDGDSSYLTYLTQKLTQRLEEVNAEREAKGEGPLCEADGTPVTFVSEDDY